MMLVLAMSLVIHPWRNSARAFLLLTAAGRRRRLSAFGELLALALTAPLVLPFLALVRLRLQTADDTFETTRADRNQQHGQAAPSGRSPVGTAVNRAIWGTANGSLSPSMALTSGTLLELWQNPTNGVDVAIHHACELIRREAVREVRLQTYLFDPLSAAGRDLIATLAMKQRSDPEFRIMAVVDRVGLDTALAGAGVQAQVAIARPRWSRRGHHTKCFIIDGRIGILGGDNIDSPREKDMMVVVEGPVIQALLQDFCDAWGHAARRLSREPLPPAPEVPWSDGAVPMAVLSKRGLARFWGDYHGNDSDQAFIAALRAARTEILIQSPALNADVVLRALIEAAARGVSIRICIPLLQHNRLATKLDAADNGSFVAFWTQLPPFLRERIQLRDFSSNGRSREENHTKFLCIDRQWIYVGSQNLDNQSFAFSRELGLGIDDPAIAETFAIEVFERDWETSLPITPRWSERWIPFPLWYH
jgi:phosphatidylserine/phosphatidylglycerophosphate/cardiolipin synthase-like enzyme